MRNNNILGTATVLILCLVVFYLPSILFQLEKDDDVWEWDLMGFVLATFYTVAFLINYFWLVPSYLLKRSRFPVLLVANILMVVLTMIFIPLWIETHGGLPPIHSRHSTEPAFWRCIVRYAGNSIRDGIMVIMAAGLAYAVRIGKEKERMRERELAIGMERREIELQSLKAQLNPHFLFNSLNNIYALIEFAPDRAKEALHSLSNMLRYTIYDSSVYVEIGREARFISEYISLMRLRTGSECSIDYKISPQLPEDARIAPMLYLTLVENAFKHSAANGHDYFIHISLDWEKNGQGADVLVFRVDNTFSERENHDEDDGKAGVGLTNVKRQLNLLYPGAYRFDIRMSGGVCRASIEIEVAAMSASGQRIKVNTQH